MIAEKEKLRRYESILLAIIKSGETPVTVRCQPAMQPRIIQAVKKEKVRYNKMRSSVDVLTLGRLKVERHSSFIRFSITYDGAQL